MFCIASRLKCTLLYMRSWLHLRQHTLRLILVDVYRQQVERCLVTVFACPVMFDNVAHFDIPFVLVKLHSKPILIPFRPFRILVYFPALARPCNPICLSRFPVYSLTVG